SGLPSNTTLLGLLSTGTITEPNGGTGSVAWNFSAQDNTFDFLAAGQTVSLTYTVQVKDSQNATASQLVTVTIHGTNDVPVIGGVSTGAVTEDVGVAAGSLTTGGALTISSEERRVGKVSGQPGTAGRNGNGTFTPAASGAWTYSADDSQAAIQQLGAGQSLTDSFTAVSSVGTASELVSVTIHGTNDVPVIGGVSTGAVTEDVGVAAGSLTTGGALTIADVDQGQSNFTAQPGTAGSNGYGTFTLAASGATPSLHERSPDLIQQLGAGQSLTD